LGIICYILEKSLPAFVNTASQQIVAAWDEGETDSKQEGS